uniref:MMS19 nucleotide excision repair protein n=1 Tax=Globodera rostochiensis TaxID=31243 RepID=A0A914HJL1_GLORO
MALAANTGLTAAQTEAVQAVVDALRDKRQTLLGYVDTERSRLTSRDAEERSAALNELCAVVLQSLLAPPPAPSSADDVIDAVARGQIDQLLPFLLSKVEDCGHLCDMLINTLHQMLKMYDGVAHVLPNECVDQAVAVLFDGGGAQSYGKRDRRLLFSCLDHLVATHAPVLRSAVGAQRVLLAFIRSAQGEREPCVLAQVFALHQRMTCNFSMGVLSEDMFELVACYFPIDYEPNEEETEPISREQLRYGCESALLAHDAFAPFCMQLVTEKLLETENDGTTPGDDGSALVKRQLEICEFFIRCCAKFCNTTNAALHEHVEDLMTAVRLLFMNPIQQRDTALLLNTTTTVKQMLHALASMLEHNTAKLNDPTRFIRLMAESTLENVEPFVLQAEMGTAGCAFCLLRCLALAHPVTRALCVPRALYWLNMLIGGQTLRSGENRAEIATEALMLGPEWLRFCFIADGVGLFVSGGDGTDRSRAVLSAEARKELISATVVPLFEAVRQLEGICELDVLLAVECEAHSVLLLFLDTVPPHQHDGIRSSFTGDGTNGEEGICRQLNDEEEEGIGQLRTLCSGMALRILPLLTTTDSEDDNDAAHLRNIVQQTDTAKWARLSAVLKQFIALSAHLTMGGGDQMDERGQKRSVRLADPKQWPRLLELLPALLQPLLDELEQRRRTMHQTPLFRDQNFASAIGSMLLSAFLEPSIDECTCTGVREMARRLTASADSTARDCFTFFVLEQLMKFVVDVVQNVHEHAVDQQFNLKRLDRLAELLQDVGALAVDNISAVHERMCHVGMDICRRHLLDHAVLFRALRTFWLLFLTHKNALLKEFAVLLMDVLKIAIGDDPSGFDADEQRWLIDALLCVQFALLNTFGNDGGTANELQQQILTSVHLPSVLLASLPLRMRAVETRNVLLAGPNAAVGAERLNQFFVDFMALSDDAADSVDAVAMANLLDVHRRPTCPERCNYRRTLFWRQRLFCQFVPIFVQFARSSTCSSVKRQVLLQLLGPLLQIVDHQLSVDSVLNELVQLHPVIVDALVDALMPQDSSVSAAFAGTDPSSLLDVLRTSLERMPPAAGSTEIAQQVPRLVHALTANIARQTLLVQSKALECLRLLALPRLGIPPEVLLPLHVCMLRISVLLAGSRKRLIRQRMALARNAWDLALA